MNKLLTSKTNKLINNTISKKTNKMSIFTEPQYEAIQQWINENGSDETPFLNLFMKWVDENTKKKRAKAPKKEKFSFSKEPDCELPENWKGPYQGQYLETYLKGFGKKVGIGRFATLSEAIEAANANDECKGITLCKFGYTLRAKGVPKTNPEYEAVSWVKRIEPPTTVVDSSETIESVKDKKNKSGKSLTNEVTFINKFNENKEYNERIIEKLGISTGNYIAIKPNIINGIIIEQTSSWCDHKSGSKELSPSPKTDVIIKNIDTQETVGISLKSGEGRATSADGYETNAIIRSVLLGNPEYLEDLELVELVNAMIDNILKEKLKDSKLNMTEMKNEFKTNLTGNGFEKEFEWYTKFKSSTKTCNELWKTIVSRYPLFKLDVIEECLSGKYKFGTNIGSATYLIKLENSESTNISDIIDLSVKNEKLETYCNSIGKSNVFAAKSSKTTIWMRFL